jgi:serine phosphatase RsbU (regulator of sigma subunit)
VLGLLENAVDPEATIEVPIQEGDRVVIYTDGFTESFNSQEETLGIDRFSEIVRETAALPVSRMRDEIVGRVAAWRSGPAADDTSLVVVGMKVEGSVWLRLRELGLVASGIFSAAIPRTFES